MRGTVDQTEPRPIRLHQVRLAGIDICKPTSKIATVERVILLLQQLPSARRHGTRGNDGRRATALAANQLFRGRPPSRPTTTHPSIITARMLTTSTPRRRRRRVTSSILPTDTGSLGPVGSVRPRNCAGLPSPETGSAMILNEAHRRDPLAGAYRLPMAGCSRPYVPLADHVRAVPPLEARRILAADPHRPASPPSVAPSTQTDRQRDPTCRVPRSRRGGL